MREVRGLLKKPVMHGMSVSSAKRLLVQVALTTAAITTLFYTTLWNRRENIYKKFYENYDADKEFERMRSKKLFDSC